MFRTEETSPRKSAATAAGSAYARKKTAAASRSRSQAKAGREIGPLPAAADPARKDRCRLDLRLFFETYFKAGRFPLPWSPAHLTAIARMQACILAGGQFALAMPRASGKTALSEAAALHGLLYGHRRFVALVGASEEAAKEMLASIKVELETNDLLAADFPEVCHPIRALDGIAHRANGQLLDGRRTRLAWTDTRVVLPTVVGSPASGSRLRVAGITGRVRGMKATVAKGQNIRPDLCIVDDPSTDDSAISPIQNTHRENVLSGAVLGLAGPGQKIACFAALTVIAPGDLADRILDRDRYPAWHGERTRMVVTWPTDRELWDRYAEIRRNSLRAGGRGEEATGFYRANRAAMDAGAAVSWPERFDPDEISAVQNAMNLRADRGERAFQAEYQNDPLAELADGQVEDLSADAIAKKTNRCPRGVVPPDCTRLTAFLDVGEKLVWYAVAGWTESFGGAVVDYGCTPRQNRAYFAKADARPSLIDLLPAHDVTARIYAGLKATAEAVVGRPYQRQGGGELRVGLCMIDTGHKPDTVYQFCREHPLSALLTPYRGYGITAGREPMSAWAQRPGEPKPGWNWRKRPTTEGGRGTHVIADVNSWKTFTAERLLTPRGGAGCLQLFGEGPAEHQLFADHLTSEFRCRTAGRGRTVDEWQQRPERPDNDWWDCLVGCAVGASVLGLQWSAAGALGEPVRAAGKASRVSFAEMKRRKAFGRTVTE